MISVYLADRNVDENMDCVNSMRRFGLTELQLQRLYADQVVKDLKDLPHSSADTLRLLMYLSALNIYTQDELDAICVELESSEQGRGDASEY